MSLSTLRHAAPGLVRAGLLLVIGNLLLVCASRPAHAKPEFPPVVRTTYMPKAGGPIDKALTSCVLCHVSAGPPNLNPYGRDVKAALKQAHASMLTPAILHSIDAKDSDGDGFSNKEEFAADTLPGDPTSKPAGKPKVAPQAGSASPSGSSNEEPSPWDLRLLLFPKHAQHPVIVHFPIALFMISLCFDVLGYWKKNPALTNAGYLNLLVAAPTALIAVVTGIMAWQFAFGGEALVGNLLLHLILGVVTTILLFVLLAFRVRRQKQEGAAWQPLYFAMAGIIFILISITGHLGGFLAGLE